MLKIKDSLAKRLKVILTYKKKLCCIDIFNIFRYKTKTIPHKHTSLSNIFNSGSILNLSQFDLNLVDFNRLQKLLIRHVPSTSFPSIERLNDVCLLENHLIFFEKIFSGYVVRSF